MGKYTTTSQDSALSVREGTLTSATGGTSSVRQGIFNVSVWGTFVATVTIERSFDAGTTWLNCSKGDGTANSFTAGFTITCQEPEAGVHYRVRTTAYTSGTVNWRFSQ
jgi:hypothetical protein